MKARKGGTACKAKQSRHNSQQKRQNKSFKTEQVLGCITIVRTFQGTWMILVFASEILRVCLGLWKGVVNNGFKQRICKLKTKISKKERWYYMKASQKFTQKDTCTDRMKLDATADIEHDLLQSLINPEHGLLKPGCMPQVQSATTGGCKQLLDAISKALKVDQHPIWKYCFRTLNLNVHPQNSSSPKFFIPKILQPSSCRCILQPRSRQSRQRRKLRRWFQRPTRNELMHSWLIGLRWQAKQELSASPFPVWNLQRNLPRSCSHMRWLWKRLTFVWMSHWRTKSQRKQISSWSLKTWMKSWRLLRSCRRNMLSCTMLSLRNTTIQKVNRNNYSIYFDLWNCPSPIHHSQVVLGLCTRQLRMHSWPAPSPKKQRRKKSRTQWLPLLLELLSESLGCSAVLGCGGNKCHSFMGAL